MALPVLPAVGTSDVATIDVLGLFQIGKNVAVVVVISTG